MLTDDFTVEIAVAGNGKWKPVHRRPTPTWLRRSKVGAFGAACAIVTAIITFPLARATVHKEVVRIAAAAPLLTEDDAPDLSDFPPPSPAALIEKPVVPPVKPRPIITLPYKEPVPALIIRLAPVQKSTPPPRINPAPVPPPVPPIDPPPIALPDPVLTDSDPVPTPTPPAPEPPPLIPDDSTDDKECEEPGGSRSEDQQETPETSGEHQTQGEPQTSVVSGTGTEAPATGGESETPPSEPGA